MSIIQSGNIIAQLNAMGILMQPDANVFIFDSSVSSFTLQDAIDACTAGNGDVIVWVGGGLEVTEQINFDKSGITLISSNRGLNRLANGEFHAIYAGSGFTDGPVAQITAPCRVIGIGFASRDTGSLFFSGAACLLGGEADAAPFGVHMLNCRFPKWGFDNRMGLGIEGSSNCLIEECDFEGVGSAFDMGIYVQGAVQNLEVKDCRFRQCTYAIEHGSMTGGNGPHFFYHGNRLEDSKMLNSNGLNALGLVSNNYYETAKATTGTYDAAVDTLIGQGINFSGNHYAEAS